MVGVEIGVGAVSLLKEMASYLKEMKNRDPELMGKFIDVQTAMYELMEQNAALMAEVQELKARASMEDDLTFNQRVGAWEKEVDGTLHRFCPKCKINGNLSPMQHIEGAGFQCGACGTSVYDPDEPFDTGSTDDEGFY